MIKLLQPSNIKVCLTIILVDLLQLPLQLVSLLQLLPQPNPRIAEWPWGVGQSVHVQALCSWWRTNNQWRVLHKIKILMLLFLIMCLQLGLARLCFPLKRNRTSHTTEIRTWGAAAHRWVSWENFVVKKLTGWKNCKGFEIRTFCWWFLHGFFCFLLRELTVCYVDTIMFII